MRSILLTLAVLGHVYGRPEPPVGYKYVAPTGGNDFGGASLSQRTSSQSSVQFNNGFNSQSQFNSLPSQNSATQFNSATSYDQSNGGYNYNVPSLKINTQSQAVPIGNINAPVGTQVFKHVSYHVAPEEPEEVQQRKNLPAVQAQKHYKIIFIKAPTYQAQQNTIVQQQAQNEEKTLVYVLVKKPEAPEDIVLPTSAPTQPSKPEVYFIKYKGNKQQVASQDNLDSISVESAAKAGKQSGSSGGSAAYGPPKYGPPNFQK